MKSSIRMSMAGLALVAVPAVAFAQAASAGAGPPPDMTHRMMMLAIQLGVILFAARLGNMLFERIRLPGVLGEVFAGIVIGPFALGGLSAPALGFPAGLFPVFHQFAESGAPMTFPVSPELYGFCAVASIILLFLVGLETDLKMFLRYSVAGSLVGLGGVVASYTLGSWTGLAFLPRLIGGEYTLLSPAVVFLGILSTATSVGITARILSERQKMETPEGVTILAGAVVDDVLGIVLLAVGLGVMSSVRGPEGVDWGAIGLLAGKTVGIWLAATVAGILAARKIGTLLKWFRDRMSIAIMALGLALILAGLFEEAKLAMIIGAYVMGLSLSRSDISKLIGERLRPIHDLFVPVFFAVMGMLVDVTRLVSVPVLAFGAIYTVVAIAAKIFGCGLPALLCNFNLRGAIRIGAGMVPRGEVALIIAGIGLSAGVLSPEIFGVSVLMTLVTTMIGPPLLVRLFHSPVSGIRRAVAAVRISPPIVYEFPTAETADLIAQKLLTVFSREGFFSHVLDPSGRIYQLRKNEVVIAFHQEGTRLVFQCDPRDGALIGTGVLEVVADFERLVRQLREPVDKERLAQRMIESSHAPRGRETVMPHLRQEAMIPRLEATGKEAVIDELIVALIRSGVINSAEETRKAVWDRETTMSTGMQHGIAVPHGRTDAVKELVCAVGLKPGGIEFGSLDGEPARIILLTVSPKSAPAPHVQFMAQIAQRLTDEGRANLMACTTAAEMMAWFLDDHPTSSISPPSGAIAPQTGVRGFVQSILRRSK